MSKPDADALSLEYQRPRGTLRSITLNVAVEDLAVARQCAELLRVPYQTLLRQWVAIGAAVAQRRQRRNRRKASTA